MARLVLIAHSFLLAAGLLINTARLLAGSLLWPATLYTAITAVCLSVALIALRLPIRPGVMLYGSVGMLGIITMAFVSKSFPWLLVLLPTGTLAIGGAFDVKAALMYTSLSSLVFLVVTLLFKDPGAGLSLIGLSIMALIGVAVMHRQSVVNRRLRRELAKKQQELGDVEFAVEVFAYGRRQL